MTEPLLQELLDEAIKPNAETIAEIISDGGIAIVAYKAGDDWRQALGIADAAPDVAVQRMPAAMRRGLVERGDSVTARWAKGKRPGRMFVVAFGGSLLVNYASGEYSIEPGSTDGETS